MERIKEMETAMTAWETLQAFCSAWFERRSAEETSLFLDNEFCFVGTGEDEFAHSLQEMKEYIAKDIREIPEPFSVTLTLFQEQRIHDEVYNLSAWMNLKNSQYCWRLRGFFTLVGGREAGGCAPCGSRNRESASRAENIIPRHWSWRTLPGSARNCSAILCPAE